MNSLRATLGSAVGVAAIASGALASLGALGGYSTDGVASVGCSFAEAAFASPVSGCSARHAQQRKGNDAPPAPTVGPDAQLYATEHTPRRAPATPPPTSPRPTPAPTASGAPASTATPSPSPPQATGGHGDGIIHTDGRGHLTLNGSRYQFAGVNAYELATWWSVNYGCGSEVGDLDGFFNSLSPNSVVRFWAFQDFTMSKRTGGRDWTPIDRVVQAAERTHQRLIFVFADQWANCHGEQYKDAAFYQGGFKTTRPPGELEPYWNWVGDVVSRYRDSAAVGMWEPISEAQGDCATVGAYQLHDFFDAVGGLIKSIDRSHLVESGLLGTDQCGVTNTDYILAQNTPNLDVVSFHDYGDSSPLPAGLAQRLQDAAQLNKPLIVGEVGFLSDCSAMQAKQRSQFAAGAAGFLPWNWDGSGESTCGF